MLDKDFLIGSSQPPATTLQPDAIHGWQMPENFALFSAEFSRDGQDLVLQDPSGAALRLTDYFAGGDPQDLLSHDGASLSARVVERLAGPLFPGQYAQAGAATLAEAIGQVETLTGTAFAQRTDGTVVQLEIGTKVFQGDVVRTEGGTTLGLTFLDGTIFTLAAGSRMVLDELIYDPQSAENKGVFDLVQGGFVFIAGEVAGSGGIEINTPAATLGIRGTTVLIDIQTQNGISTVSVSLNPDPDGGTGEIELRDLSGELISTITTTETKWIIRPPFTNEPPIEVERTQTELNDDAVLLNQAVAAFQSAVGRVANGQEFVEFEQTQGEAVEDTPVEDTGEPPSDPAPSPTPPIEDTQDAPDGDESDGDTQELDGNDEPVPEGDTPPSTIDDAQIETPEPTTEVADNTGNRAPEFATTPIPAVEDTPFTGAVPVTDREGDAIEVTLVQGATNGEVVLSRDGTFTYTPDENFEGTDSFVVRAEDSEGGVTESEVTVAVNSVNDAPVVSVARTTAAAREAGISAGPEGGTATGQIAYSDVDEGETQGTWTIAAAADNATAFGQASIDPESGTWAYELDQVAADVLGQDETAVETFIATVTDAEGATATSEVVVTVTGTNDGPVITSALDQATGTLSEAMTGFDTTLGDGPGGAPSGPGSVSGTLAFQDADLSDNPQWAVTTNPGNPTALGSIAIDPDTGVWTYTLNEEAADALGNGDVVTETFTAQVTDEFGANATQEISVTITGLNDAPTIEFSIEDISATVFEDGFVASAGQGLSDAFPAMEAADADASGTLRYVDPDGQLGDVATWSVSPDGPSLGEMTIDPASGEWHYFLDEDAAQGLRQGEEVIETFTAMVTDGLGAASTQTITITIVGANDPSEIVVEAGDLEGSVEDGGQSTATGTLTYVDPEAQPGEVSTWSIAPNGPSLGSMTIGPETGVWLYTLDQTAADVLAQGETRQELFTATLTDTFGATSSQIITISLTGQNDAPVISDVATSGMVKEAGASDPGTPSATGTLIALDPDQGTTASFWTIQPDPANGTALGAMQINPQTGTWTYTLSQSAAQSMETGDSVTERFEATITDAFGATDSIIVEIQIDGTNDAPVLSVGTTAAVENGPAVTFDLAALASDPDANQDAGDMTFSLAGSPSEGSAQISGSTLTFDPGADFQDLAAGETRTVSVDFAATDAEGASSQSTVQVTVTGINTRPTFEADASGEVDEDQPSLTLNLAAFGDDPDNGENGSDLEYALIGAPSAGSASVSGNTLTFVPGGDFSDLGAGDTTQVNLLIRATDPGGLITTGSVVITVTGTNAAPTLTGTTFFVEAQGPAETINLASFGDDPDPDENGTTLTYQIISPPASGSAAINGTILSFNPNNAFDDLGDGETRNVTVGVRASDAEGESDVATFTVTVTGNNEAPVITSAATDAEGAVEEAGTSTPGVQTASGTLSYFDVDEAAPNDGTWSISPANSPLGAISIGANGIWTYTLDNAAADSLNDGEVRVETFTATITDTSGASASQTVTITVTGSNDAPQLDTSTSEIDADGGSIQIPLAPLASDVDAGDTDNTLSYSISRAPNEGTLTLTNGVLEFFVGSDFDDLPNEVQQTVTFDVTVTDPSGASTTTTLSVVVTGTQTAPMITSSAEAAQGSVTEAGTDPGPAPITTGGTLTYDDPDAETPTSGVWTISGAAALGSIEIDPETGVWLYTLDNNLSDELDDGDEITEEFLATITDADGLTDTQVVTVTVQGTNDAPTLQAATTAVDEDQADVSVNLRALASDPDADDTPANLSFLLDNGPADGAASVVGGTLRFFTSGDFEDLAEGETRSVFVDVEVRDPEGETALATFQFDVTGTNDAPIVNVASSTFSGAVTEAGVGFAGNGAAADASGTLTYTDVDEQPGGLGTWSATPIGVTLGNLVINPTTGAWEYFLNETAADSLREGAVVQDQFTAVITDAFGATDSQVITINITGTNDGPVIDAMASDTAAGYEEGDPTTLTGQLLADDPDNVVAGPVWSIVVDPVDGGDNYGNMSINPVSGLWTYVADTVAVEMIPEGDIEFDYYNATITDEFGETSTVDVTISLTGTNAAPTIFAAVTETDLEVTEAGAAGPGIPSASGQLSFSDPDGGAATGPWSILPSAVTVYGSAVISGTGLWTYTLNQGAADILNEGQTATELFQAQYTDIFGAPSNLLDVQVTVTGVNDAPTMTAQSQTVDADGGLALQLRPVSDDVDMEHESTDLTFALNGAVSAGMASVTPQGLFTFNPNGDFDDLAGGEIEQVVVGVTVSDPLLASSNSTVTITVTGVNDAPELVGPAPVSGQDFTEFANTAGSTTEHTATGAIDFTDADLTDVGHTTTVTGATATGATAGAGTEAELLAYLSITGTTKNNGAGVGQSNWSFAAEDQDFDYLAAGDTLTITYDVDIDDQDGGVLQTQLEFTVEGANDAPQIGLPGSQSFTLLNPATGSTNLLGDFADILFSDLDIADIGHATTITGVTTSGVTTGLPNNMTLESFLTLATTKPGTADNGSIRWTFQAQEQVFDYLGAGQVANIVYALQVDDMDGGTDNTTVSLAFTGVNNTAIITGDTSGTATEDTMGVAASGNLNHTDADGTQADDVWQVVTMGASTYGTYTVDASGNWAFTLDNGNAMVNALNPGDTLSDTLTAVTEDGTQQSISITIQGANDTGTVSGDTTGAVTEDLFPNTDSGDLNYVDTDGPDDQWTVQTNVASTLGTYSIDASGNWSYALNNGNAAVNALDAGDMTTDSFTVETTDGTQQQVTITITGANDPALVTGITAAGIVEDNAPGFVSGNLNHTDVDGDDADDVWQEITAASNTASDMGYGTVEITTAGVWTYTLDNNDPAVNALQLGDPVLVDTFTVLTGDGTTRQVTINIAGANDAPTAADDVANITVDAGIDVSGPEWNEFNGHYYQFIPANTAGGNSDFGWEEARLDAIARGGHLATVTSAAENNFIHTLNGGQVGWLGGSDATTEGTWEWVVGPEAGLAFWTGGVGGNTVGGRYALWAPGQPTGGVEDYLHSFGTAAWNDLEDAGAANQIMGYFLEYSGPQANGNLALNSDDPEGEDLAFALTAPVAGLTLFEDGVWTFDLINSTYDSLGASEMTTVVANYTVTDEQGATDPGTLTLNITGINDAAVVTGATSLTISENTASGTGNLNHTDVDGDNTDDLWQAQIGLNASDMGYGTYTIDTAGVWVFTLNNANTMVNALNVGDVLNDSFTVQTEDGTEQVVSVTIQGTNDPATVGAVKTSFLFEDNPNDTANDTVTATDPDNPDNTFQPVLTATASDNNLGTYTINSTGDWLFTLDNLNPAVNALGQGQSTVETITIFTIDTTSDTIDITINGANDAATVTGATSGTIVEDSSPGFIGGNLDHTDPDANNANDLWIAEGAALNTTNNGYGTHAVDTAGNWSFFLNNSVPAVNALNNGETLSDSFEVQTEDGTTQLVNITIQGNDDAPVVFGEAAVIDLGAIADPGAGWSLFQGNYYQYVSTPQSWTDARADALANGAYLANITSVNEHNFVNTLKGGDAAWLGGNDIATEGVWVWADGPEAGQQFWQGDGATGHSVGGAFQFWLLPSVPDNAGGNEDALLVSTANVWNDAPTTFTIGYIAEYDAPQVFTGDVSTNDSDPEGLGLTFSLVNPFAGLTMNTDGTWTFDQTTTTAYDSLGTGQSQNYNVAYNVEDPGSNVSSGTLVLTINGTNDAAVITGDTSDTIAEDAIGAATGDLNHTDVDANNTNDLWQVQAPGTVSDGGYGTYRVDADGQWVYLVDSANTTVDALGDGDNLIDTFVALTEDGTRQVVTVTITGTNDAPVATAATANVTAETAVDTSGPEWSAFNGSHYQFVPQNFGAGEFTWAGARADALAKGGYLANITSAAENTFIHTLNGGDVGWLGGSDSAVEGEWRWVDGPEAGQQFWQGGIGGTTVGGLFASWAASQPDGEDYLHSFGGGTWNDIDDAGAANQIMGYWLEYTTPLASGTLAGNASDAEMEALTFAQVGSATGLTINSDGTWTFDRSDPAFVSLGASETTDIVATYSVTDPALASDTASFTITVAGVNDAAVITGDNTGTVIEDSVVSGTASGNADHTDVDNDNNDDVWQVENAGTATFGTFTVNASGAWEYTLDNGNTTVDALNNTGTLFDSFTILAEDGTSQLININIGGANDAAIITGNTSGTVVEDAPNVTSGNLDYTDVDNPDDVWTGGGTVIGAYGNWFTNTQGQWSYTLNNANTAVNDLNDGETLTEGLVMTTTDGTQQAIIVTIQGTTDVAPLVANNDSGFIETINVLVVGTNSGRMVDTRDQLANDTRFDFNVTLQGLETGTSGATWDSRLDGIDVVVLGGVEAAIDLDGLIGYQKIADFNAAGGGVVTTGGIITQYFDVGAATDALIDQVTPIGIVSGGVSSSTAVDLDLSLPIHPVLDDTSDINMLATSSWKHTNQVDVGAVQLATVPGGNGSSHAISIKPGAGGTGNQVFIGGSYLDQTISDPFLDDLRVGDPDALLEQAVAWAAGVQKIDVDENNPFIFTLETLLANDENAETATITAVDAISTKGAAVSILGGNVNYNPLPSAQLDQSIGDGQTTTDTFTYTITDGGQMSTATVTVTVNGISDTDAPPVLASSEMNGFGADASVYDFGQGRFTDADQMTGISYTVRNFTVETNPLPTGFSFDPIFNEISVTPSGTLSYIRTLKLSAYEADGQSDFFIFGYSVDSSGEFRFVTSSIGGEEVLEISPYWIADTGGMVDLAGVEALGPNVLDGLSVLDIQNGVGSEGLDIDTASLLQLVNGNGATQESIRVELDMADVLDFVDDNNGSAQGWEAVETSPGSGVYQLNDTNLLDGLFSDSGAQAFAIITVDGGTVV